MQTHNSVPFNLDIANTFFRAGYIEAWGRGIEKICEECKNLGVKNPEYSYLGNTLMIKFTALKQKVERNIRYNETDLNERILSILKDDPHLSITEISEHLKSSNRTIQRCITNLKNANIIERVGGRK